MIEYVAGFLFSEDKKHVLLIQKNKPEWQKGLYNAVGGKIEPEETPLDAMHREFYEETGLSGMNWQPSMVLKSSENDMMGNPQWRVYFFEACSDKLREAVGVDEEPVAVYGVHCLPENTINNIPALVNLALSDCFIKPINLINKVNRPK